MDFKKIFFALSFLFIVFLSANGQSSTISGKVSDTEGNAIEFASVILLSLPDSAMAASISSDSLGTYIFTNIKPGEYIIKVLMFGYMETVSDKLIINESSAVQKVDWVLTEEQVETGDVVIATTRKPIKPLVRVEADKIVVDVENGVANSGLTALDVLRRSPGVSVDQDGKIALKGKRGVLIMLDGNPLYMSEEQVANLLKSIPSDQIKEIELITSPSAKYDAVGNAGIINIKLKKGAYEGLNGSVTGSFGYGVYHKSNAGVNITYKKKKISFNAGYQYNDRENFSDYYYHRSFLDPSAKYSILNSDAYFRLPENAHSLNFSGEYALNEKSNFSFDINNNYSGFSWKGGTVSKLFNKDNSLSSAYNTKDVGGNKQIFLGLNTGFQHMPDTNGTVISLGLSYNKSTLKEAKNFMIHYLDSTGNDTGNYFLYILKESGYNNNFSAKADFTKFIYKKIKLETGLKMNAVVNNKPADITITENFITRDASNHFLYKENIYAAYAMMNKSINKWKLQGGLRLEKTHVEGTQTIIDSTFIRNYTNLFPSGGITYNATAKSSYSIQYSKRIQRPGASQLNPILAIVDPYTSWGGNPYLLPQYANNFDLIYSILNGYVVTTIGYTNILHPIIWVDRVDPVTSKTIGGYVNLKSQNGRNISLAVNMPITKWWNTSNYVLVYYNKYAGDLGYGEIVKEQTAWLANSTQTMKLPGQFTLEFSGVYQGPNIYGLARYKSRWQANAGLSKKLWNNRATMKIAISDILFTYQYVGNTNSGNSNIATGEKWDNRVVMFTFSYKFGKRLMWDSK
jgi:outer membrane receptor protein involved in Fe transport